MISDRDRAELERMEAARHGNIKEASLEFVWCEYCGKKTYGRDVIDIEAMKYYVCLDCRRGFVKILNKQRKKWREFWATRWAETLECCEAAREVM